MKKILFINHSSDTYGAETVLLQLLAKVFQDNKEMIYTSEPVSQGKSLFKKEINKLGLYNHFVLPYKNLGGSLLRSSLVMVYNIYAIIQLLFIVNKNKIDIIYSNTSVTCIGVVLAMLTRKKHIWHFHEPIETEHGWVKSLSVFYKILLSYKRNVVIFVSNTQKQQWLNQFPTSFDNSMLIYNPIKEVEIQKNHQSSIENTVFGYMGSWTIRKNIPVLLKVFAALHLKYPKIKLLLAKNKDEFEITKLINEMNLSDCVESGKIYNDISDFYSDIDISVLPSLSETWGLVALEAMAAEKAVILTQNTGLKEILENGVDCIFIDPYSENNLYQAMEKVLLDEQYRKQLAKNGYNKIKKMDFNNQFVSKFNSLFESND